MENKAEAKNLKTMIITKSTTVAFTGYRASKILAPGQDPKDLQAQIIDQLTPIIETLYSEGYRTFLCGMSDGFDLWAAMAVVVAKDRHKDINLIAVTPFQGQEKNYSQADKNLYNHILSHSIYQIIISQTNTTESYLKRNDYMLENSSHIIAYYDGRQGGTMYTINRAIKQGHTITNLLK